MSATRWEPRQKPMGGMLEWPYDRCPNCGRSLYTGGGAEAGVLFCKGCDERGPQCYCPAASPMRDTPA